LACSALPHSVQPHTFNPEVQLNCRGIPKALRSFGFLARRAKFQVGKTLCEITASCRHVARMNEYFGIWREMAITAAPIEPALPGANCIATDHHGVFLKYRTVDKIMTAPSCFDMTCLHDTVYGYFYQKCYYKISLYLLKHLLMLVNAVQNLFV
jgi:hypothetical protein